LAEAHHRAEGHHRADGVPRHERLSTRSVHATRQ
jgi:hypothetical protein